MALLAFSITEQIKEIAKMMQDDNKNKFKQNTNARVP